MATRTVEIEDSITVGALAEQLQLPVTSLVAELMKNGMMVTVNERIDFDTAVIVVGELDKEIELVKKEAQAKAVKPKKERSLGGQSRPPVVAVMGHVDHGKTSLLDAICSTKIAGGEAGGITQHISAYQVEHDKRKITFLDTPGHAAFAAIREHGAHLTDVVIIVVAADDGIMPQTIEAIRFATQAGVKIVVAINKIDKEGSDPNRVKQQLAEHNILVEGWGGDTVVAEVSAKTKQGIEQLLDLVLLVSDIEELTAEVKGPARGLIIEAHQEQGRGPVGVALVESGTLQRGDFIVAGTTYAKVRNLESTTGSALTMAGPSTPAIITGFKGLPEFGDEFIGVNNEKEARSKAAQAEMEKKQDGSATDLTGHELIRIIDRQKKVNELNVVIKADVQGSLTSVINSLQTLNTDEVAVRVVGSGVGVITEKDVHLAATSGSIVYGFNVQAPTSIKRLSARDKVSLRLFGVIYELIDDVKNELSGLLSPEIIRTDYGRLLVRAIFKTTKSDIICGGEVTKGKIRVPAYVDIYHDDELIGEHIEVIGLKRGPQEAKEVPEGEMCGVHLKTPSKIDIQEGDRLEFYSRVSQERSL